MFSGWIFIASRQTFSNHIFTLPRFVIQTGKTKQIGAKKFKPYVRFVTHFKLDNQFENFVPIEINEKQFQYGHHFSAFNFTHLMMNDSSASTNTLFTNLEVVDVNVQRVG